MAEFTIALVQSGDEIKRERRKIKEASTSVVTNFTVFPREYESWIKDESIYVISFDRCSYFIHETARGDEVFFFADTYESVLDSLNELKKNLTRTTVLEIVQKHALPLLGSPMMILQRMSSTVIPRVNLNTLMETDRCTSEELSAIENILLTNFDPLAERIPTVSHLTDILHDPKKGGIFISKYQNNITGLMVYSIDSSTIHLRYWWTDPDYRNQGIGSKLLNRFFHQGEDCKRMILWVRIDNEEAISRYIHYGFIPEQMFDYIYKIK